jgi:predicted amidophosphoribosyltransferase
MAAIDNVHPVEFGRKDAPKCRSCGDDVPVNGRGVCDDCQREMDIG